MNDVVIRLIHPYDMYDLLCAASEAGTEITLETHAGKAYIPHKFDEGIVDTEHQVERFGNILYIQTTTVPFKSTRFVNDLKELETTRRVG